MSDVTRLIEAAQAGNRQAANQLLPLVYNELCKLAAVRMTAESPGHTLDATALVHEAYLRLVRDQQFEGCGHFFAAAAESMRRILVDHARARATGKRGGGRNRISLDCLPATEPDDLIAFDDVLSRLTTEDPIAAKVVELRHFAGLGYEDTAQTLGITVYQTRQKWKYARAWLQDALG